MPNWWDEIEAEALKRGEEQAKLDADPAYQARMKAKKAEEFAKGVRLGWWDTKGNDLPQPEDDPEEEDWDGKEDGIG